MEEVPRLTPQPPAPFGQRIRQCRQQKGWTQTQAAKIMGVQRTSLNRWENGHETPSGENIAKLSDHLGVSIGSAEHPVSAASPEVHQLSLPFQPRLEVELRIRPKRADTVQLEVQLKTAG